MSRILDLRRKGLYTPSLESSVVEENNLRAVPEEELLQTDIGETNAHRAEVQGVVEHVDQIDIHSQELSAALDGASAVNFISAKARDLPVEEHETYTNESNSSIADIAKRLEVPIPHLNADKGKISEQSMEGLGSWLADAGKGIWNAAGKFFESIATGLSRMSKTAEGFDNRIQRIQGKMNSRKGNGGKVLKLSGGVKNLLVVGHNYVKPAQAGVELKKFGGVVQSIVEQLEKYMSKVDDSAKKELLASIINDWKQGAQVVETHEYANAIATIIHAHSDYLMGNVKYVQKESREHTRILGCMLESMEPAAAQIVRHVDPLVSLTQAEIAHLLPMIDNVVRAEVKQIDSVIRITSKAFNQLHGAIQGMTETQFDEHGAEVEHTHSADIHRLRTLEHGLVDEMNQVGNAMIRLHKDLMERIDAVLHLVEESVFQD